MLCLYTMCSAAVRVFIPSWIFFLSQLSHEHVKLIILIMEILPTLTYRLVEHACLAVLVLSCRTVKETVA